MVQCRVSITSFDFFLVVAAMKKLMGEEMQELIVRVKHIVAVQTGKPEEAEDLEHNCIKIVAKLRTLCVVVAVSLFAKKLLFFFFKKKQNKTIKPNYKRAGNLHSAGIITEKDLKPVDDPLRKALRLILKVFLFSFLVFSF